MLKLSKNIQSNFPGKEKCYLYAKYYYIPSYRLQFGSTKKCVLKKSIWMAKRESESAVPDMLEFS